MNQKILVVVLAVVLIATCLAGTVVANRGQTKKVYVDYKFDAILADPVVSIVVTPPTIVIEGYRSASGIQSCIVTINGETYSYPEDFSYAENFRIEGNVITKEGVLEVQTVLTFNLPGKPTITEWLIGKVTNIGTGNMVLDGAFYLTGTKMFNKVEGGGITASTQINGVDYALHLGQMKGWPLGN